MKKFEKPDLTTQMFTVEDVLTTSGADDRNGAGVFGVPFSELFEEAEN